MAITLQLTGLQQNKIVIAKWKTKATTSTRMAISKQFTGLQQNMVVITYKGITTTTKT